MGGPPADASKRPTPLLTKPSKPITGAFTDPVAASRLAAGLFQRVIALLQGVHVPFLRSRHGRANEQTCLHLALVATLPIAQRVTGMNVRVRHYLTERFAPKNNAECGGLFELLAVLKALEQGANVLFHETVFQAKNGQLVSGQDPDLETALTKPAATRHPAAP